MSAVRIEQAGEADLAAIVALMNAGAVGVRIGAESDDLSPYLAAFRRIAESPDAHIYVARDEDEGVIGCFTLTSMDGLAFRGRPRTQIESMHVREDQRSRGIGRRMLEFAVEKARERDCCMVQLTSNRERVDAHRFYERHGFVPSHVGFKLML
ncbi:GNAT family N-acetyltransferase [Rhizobiales bacterium]|uniref:GNAT family N-acetyltransferase n=1 Tax=Hongsoonwoonella zoysiae TaxID=2821844 RepID=UPI0015600DAD|nr:GNAT family N-acetyltransferase [Hongsoonwoonella zoysiae]NRG19137.1 GNAT family N-acetyltransferase [Hongsoonwoonella zoysiae]